MNNPTKSSLLAIVFVLSLLPSIEANASTFTLLGGDDGFIPDDWNPSPIAPGLAIDDPIKIFNEADEGVWLDGPAELVYTYIGKEAGSTNAFLTFALSEDELFLTSDFDGISGTTPGSTFETSMSSAGYLEFLFWGLGTCCVEEGVFVNGDGIVAGDNAGLSLAVAMISETSLYLMFGDGFGDADYDDMIVRVDVSAVPLPASAWLFGTALLGFIGIARRTTI